MKYRFAVAFIAAFLIPGILRCTRDYNPFENSANAQVHLLPQSCSEHIRNHDTLVIFSTETLAVYTTVREKIDSIAISTPGNRLNPYSVLHTPFSSDSFIVLLSYPDTGLKLAAITGTRTNGTAFSLSPMTYYVRSPLKQDSIFRPLGGTVELSTPMVKDGDVYYFWSFGTSPGDTIKSPFSKYFLTSAPGNILPGEKGIGFLWVTDTAGKMSSPASPFRYEFYRPKPPIILCTTRGLFNRDSIISGDTLVFTIQVIDSSGVGINNVTVNGSSMSSSDSRDYSMIFTGLKSKGYTNKNPDTLIAKAINNVNDSAKDTLYCFYDSTGPGPGLVKLTLVNPTSSITTRLGNILFEEKVDKFVSDTANVKVLRGSTVYYSQPVIDSVKTILVDLPILPGKDTITTSVYIHGQKYADTSIVVTQNLNAVDTTFPRIITLKINKKVCLPNQNTYSYTLSQTDSNINVSVLTVDNISGISSVVLTDSSTTGNKSYPLSYDQSTFSWITGPNTPILFTSKTVKEKIIMLSIKNGVGSLTQRAIYVFKK